MSFLDSLLAFTLGLCGLLIILGFCKLIFQNLIGDFPALIQTTKLRRRQRKIALADAFIKEETPAHALPLLAGAFYFDLVKKDREFIDKIHGHHLDILNRLLTISEGQSRYLENLPVVEGLLQSRTDFLKLRLEILETIRSLKLKRMQRGQATPEWALSEFLRKLKEIEEKLTVNKTSLERQVKSLFATLEQVPESREVTYH